MQKLTFYFKLLVAVSSVLSILSCAGVDGENGQDSGPGQLTFAVLNVGQGLSQATVVDGRAILWDMGDTDEFAKWQDGYRTVGFPSIDAVVISHGDMDHKGGLKYLSADAPFSGLVVVSPYEDTASLRAFATNWSSLIRFRIAKQGDTLALIKGAYVECIWPPKSPETDQWIQDNFDKNRLSLCFRVEYGNTSFLMTGDIDTLAEEKLVERYFFELSSDIVSVPHHGSRSSLHTLFYGYVNPAYAVISCGLNNQYGHPADEVVRLLAFQMMVTLYDTRYDGHVIAASNGEYWEWHQN